MTTQTLLTPGNGLHTAPLVLQPVGRSRWPRRLLTPGRHTIGARADSDVHITVRGMADSHAIIEVTGSEIWLTAIDRRTWVNDGPVVRCELQPGDRVTIGPCTWALRPATPDDLLSGWPAPQLTTATPDVQPNDEAPIEPPPPAGPQALALIDETARLLSTVEPLSEEEAAAAPTVPPAPVIADEPAIVEPPPSPPVAAPAAVAPALPTNTPAPAELLRLHDSLLELRADLDRARTAWREETHRREVELAAESTAIARRGAALERAEHNFHRQRQEFESERQQWEARAAAQQRLSADLSRQQSELIAERDRIEQLAQQTRDELEAETLRQNSAWLAWEESQQRMLADLTEQARQLEVRRTALAAEREELQQARSELERARRELAQAQREFGSEREQWTAEARIWETRREAMTAQHAAAIEQIERQQAQLSNEVRERGRQQTEFLAAQQQLQHDRRQFAELQHAWLTERETIWSDLSERRQRLESETFAIDQTRSELEQLQATLEAERYELTRQRKLATEAQAAAESVSDEAEHARIAAADSIQAAEEFAAAQLAAAVAESELRQARILELEADLAAAQLREQALDDELHSVAARIADAERELSETRETLMTSGSMEGDNAPTASEADHATDFEAVQEALDALAARFEEFSELEQRLANKHDELRDLQHDLAAREAELESREQAWSAEHAITAEHHASPTPTASAVASPEELADIAAEKARWAAHLIQLQRLVETADSEVVATPTESSFPEHDTQAGHNTHGEPPAAEAPASNVTAEPIGEPVSLMGDVDPQGLTLELPFQSQSMDDSEPAEATQSSFIPVDPLAGSDVDAAPRQNPWLRFRENLLRDSATHENPFEGATGSSNEITPADRDLPSFEAAPTWSPAAPYDAGVASDWVASALPFSDTEDTPRNPWAAPAYDTFAHTPIEETAEQPTAAETDASSPRESNNQPDEHSPLAAASLRSELAKMFDLPEDFVQKRGNDSTTPEIETLEEPAGQGAEEILSSPAPSATDTPEETEEDDWRSRLSAALTQMPNHASEPEPSPELDRAEVAEPAYRASGGSEEDDSVASYMAQLLARTRRSSTYEPEEEPAPSIKSSPVRANVAANVAADAAEVAEPAEFRPPPAEPRTKLDKDATRAELQSFRQVANLSARAALARHTWRTTSTELTIQTALAGCCALGAGAYLGAGLLGHQVQWLPGIGCSVGAAFVGYRAWQTLSKLRQWSRTIEEAAKVASQGSTESAAEAEDEDAVSPELLAALLAGSPAVQQPVQQPEPCSEVTAAPLQFTPSAAAPAVNSTPLTLEEELLRAEPLGSLPPLPSDPS